MQNKEKIRNTIWWINFWGCVILLTSIITRLVFGDAQNKTLFLASMGVSIIGFFMTAIKIPSEYPKMILALTIYDIWTLIVISLCLGTILLYETITEQISIGRAITIFVGCFVIYIVGGILTRLAHRVGAKLAQE